MSDLPGIFSVETIETLAATFAAAGAGAWFAQAFIFQREDRKELLDEVRAVNSAVLLAIFIANKFISLKGQHVRGILMRYDAEQQAYGAFLADPKPVKAFEAAMDLRIFTPPRVPATELQTLCLEKIHLGSKAIAALSDLMGVIDAVSTAMEARTRLVEEHRTRQPKRSMQEAVFWYLGVPDLVGHRDEMFKTNVEAIGMYTDDCIFFARVLSDELLTHGREVRSSYWWKHHRRARLIGAADWTPTIRAGLMPSDTQYVGWLRGFRDRQPWWKFWARRRSLLRRKRSDKA